MSIGDIMRERRVAAGLTVKECRERGGPPAQVQRLGLRDVTVREFLDWCDAIGCKPEEVFAEIVAERSTPS